MVAYNFKRRFVDPIRSGLGNYEHIDGMIPAPKRQTIRARGKRRHARPGETLQLFYGQRSSKCFRIGEARCTRADDIRIMVCAEIIEIRRADIGSSLIDKPAALDAFARGDGFQDWADMRDFWREEHGDLARLGPFVGVLILWEPLP